MAAVVPKPVDRTPEILDSIERCQAWVGNLPQDYTTAEMKKDLESQESFPPVDAIVRKNDDCRFAFAILTLENPEHARAMWQRSVEWSQNKKWALVRPMTAHMDHPCCNHLANYTNTLPLA